MKSYTGRRVRIYEHDGFGLVDTGKAGRLLEIDIHHEHVMIEDEAGNLVKLNHRLVKLV